MDVEHDKANQKEDRRITCPMLHLWASGGPLDTFYEQYGGALGIWQKWADSPGSDPEQHNALQPSIRRDGVAYSGPEIPQQRQLSNISARSRLGFQTEKCPMQRHWKFGIIELYAHCIVVSGTRENDAMLARQPRASSFANLNTCADLKFIGR